MACRVMRPKRSLVVMGLVTEPGSPAMAYTKVVPAWEALTSAGAPRNERPAAAAMTAAEAPTNERRLSWDEVMGCMRFSLVWYNRPDSGGKRRVKPQDITYQYYRLGQ